MKLDIADMIYNSKEIRDGEIQAIDFFLRMNYKIYQSDPSFQIEDLISDEFFQSDSLKMVYDDFMEQMLDDDKLSLDQESARVAPLTGRGNAGVLPQKAE